MITWEHVTIPLLVHNRRAILDQWGEGGRDFVRVAPGPQSSANLVAYLKCHKGEK